MGETNPFAESSDMEFAPDLVLADGARVEGDGWSLTGLTTPGHTANHMAFALDGTGILFSADHVMAWATTIVAPPDGAMADYMASLEKLLYRDDHLYLPGHGGPVTEPASFLRACAPTARCASAPCSNASVPATVGFLIWSRSSMPPPMSGCMGPPRSRSLRISKT